VTVDSRPSRSLSVGDHAGVEKFEEWAEEFVAVDARGAGEAVGRREDDTGERGGWEPQGSFRTVRPLRL
jgi:hypothetical protein